MQIPRIDGATPDELAPVLPGALHPEFRGLGALHPARTMDGPRAADPPRCRSLRGAVA